jgi:hypothetical protein
MLYPDKTHLDGRAVATVSHRAPIGSPQAVHGGKSFGGRPSMVLRQESEFDEAEFTAALLTQTAGLGDEANLWHYKV